MVRPLPRPPLRGALAAALLVLGSGAAGAQPYEPGPIGAVPGSSVSGMRIDGAPRLKPAGRRIPNAYVFGDSVEERAYGRPYDNSYLSPRVPRPGLDDDRGNALRAREGRSAIDPAAAGAYALDGPGAIGGSAVTRGRSTGPHRAIIRRD